MDGMKKYILDSMEWSFSSVNAYDTCPKMFKMTYIDASPKWENAFAQFGSLCHKVLEEFYRGEITMFDTLPRYLFLYDEYVKQKFPKTRNGTMESSYRDSGEKYFEEFENDFAEYEVLGVEEEFHIKIENRNFVGFVDLILRDKDGNIVIVDHKSKSKFKSEEEKKHYARQLYLYSLYVKEKFGEHPKLLFFNMFRTQQIERIEFNQEDCDEAKKWFLDTIERIYQDEDFKENPSKFFCDNICSTRPSCEESYYYRGEKDDS